MMSSLAGTVHLKIGDLSTCLSRRHMLILDGLNRDVVRGKSLFSPTWLGTLGKLIG